MSKQSQTATRLAIVGGGVIGLATAWRAARAGYAVTLVDPAAGDGASLVAGGMLAPISEAWPGEEDVLRLGELSLRQWPEFAAELASVGGELGLRAEGTVLVGYDSADREQLTTLADYLATQDRQVERLTGRQLRALEPGVGAAIRSGLHVPGEYSVDAQLLLRALGKAAAGAGVVFRSQPAESVGPGSVRLADGSRVDCEVVLLAAGAWSAGLHEALAGVVRPLKGEILRLRARPGCLPPPARTVRAAVSARPIYLVPKDGSELVLGATQYEAGFDTLVTAGGVRDLLADAERVLPSIREYELLECAAAPRAGSADNLPTIGWLEPGVLAATGHHRNGLLLAPVTAAAVLDYLAGVPVPEAVAAASPERWRRSREDG
ncbi:glycine oxidase [Tamaricihabitans halophyticus]|uniref:glycine oxidase n=1 Tax=Tamaricihabitans halophyticus TaxID=1262583 RepID=A0A4R2R402_9PSEU|nr:glycine oxidase ThiO [Tamaricihabitans halophyticus]TCP56614.1 glycine oxidase [Tamaricihabitans halophyticus]